MLFSMLTAVAALTAPPTTDDLSWMAGYWLSCADGGQEIVTALVPAPDPAPDLGDDLMAWVPDELPAVMLEGIEQRAVSGWTGRQAGSATVPGGAEDALSRP